MARLNLPVDILLWEQMIGEMPLKVITLNLLICVHAYKLGRCDLFCFYAKTFGKVKKVDFSRSKFSEKKRLQKNCIPEPPDCTERTYQWASEIYYE